MAMLFYWIALDCTGVPSKGADLVSTSHSTASVS